MIDEGIRHSITKHSHLHFVSTKTYFKRVQQLGENKKNIFNVGSLGVEAIKKEKLYLKQLSLVLQIISKLKWFCKHNESFIYLEDDFVVSQFLFFT